MFVDACDDCALPARGRRFVHSTRSARLDAEDVSEVLPRVLRIGDAEGAEAEEEARVGGDVVDGGEGTVQHEVLKDDELQGGAAAGEKGIMS